MSLNERYESEKQKWDGITEEQAQELEIFAPDFEFHQFARSNSETPGVSEFLGDIKGRKVLEIGCGSGYMATLLSRSKALVTAFDLSPQSVRTTRKRAELNQTELDVLVSAGENLPFQDESFDIVIGKAILHHLMSEIGSQDIRRVLRKGGRAVFVEPMGMNPILTFVRKYIPYPHKNAVGIDEPLTYQVMDAWTDGYQYREYREIQLLSMVERAFGWETTFPILRKMDAHILKHIPFLRRFCRYVIIYAVK